MSGITLKIPPGVDEAIALETLIRQNNEINWDYTDTSLYFSTLLEVLEKWSNHILDQLNKLYKGTSGWNPSLALAEIMAVALLRSGKVKIQKDINYSDVVIRHIWKSESPDIQETLKNNYSIDLGNNGEKWLDWQNFISSLYSGTKGETKKDSNNGRWKNDFKNSLPIKNCLEEFFTDFQFSQTPPDDIKDSTLRRIASSYLEIKNEFKNNFDSEKREFLDWKLELEKSLGSEKNLTELISTMKSILSLARNTGTPIGDEEVRRTLNTLLRVFDDELQTLLEDRIENINKLSETKDTAKSLVLIASIDEYRKDINKLLELSKITISFIARNLKQKLDALNSDVGEGLKESEGKIKGSVNSISEMLNKIEQL